MLSYRFMNQTQLNLHIRPFIDQHLPPFTVPFCGYFEKDYPNATQAGQ